MYPDQFNSAYTMSYAPPCSNTNSPRGTPGGRVSAAYTEADGRPGLLAGGGPQRSYSTSVYEEAKQQHHVTQMHDARHNASHNHKGIYVRNDGRFQAPW
jgi:hypothetical protein